MFSKALQMIDSVLAFFEEWSLFLIIMIALGALVLNLLLRYCFDYTLIYSEDIARIAVIYTTCIGCCYSVKNRSIIKMEAIIILWPKVKIPLEYFCHFATILFAAMAVYYGFELAVLQSRVLSKAFFIGIPAGSIYLVLPFMGILMLIHSIYRVYLDTVNLLTNRRRRPAE